MILYASHPISSCSVTSGHLPVKLPDYNNRLRVLVATYVTFSPDGTELLVNMGGEQVTEALEVKLLF